MVGTHVQLGEMPVVMHLSGFSALPARRGVVGAVPAAVFLRIDAGVHACSLRRAGGGKPDAAERALRPAVTGEARPAAPAVRGLVETALGPDRRREIAKPRPVADLPDRGE